ncbi:hypothetical protein T06_8186 [Trichinella sp. T6]|nr:hypothetical protein T06_8186 [Trichinella sp. T6]
MDGKDSKRNNKPRQSSLIKAQSLIWIELQSRLFSCSVVKQISVL